MPIYDFYCDTEGEDPGCGLVAENIHMSFEEYDLMKSFGGLPCPECPGVMQVKIGNVKIEFKKVVNRRGAKEPGGKREMRQMMEYRYKKRNKRLDGMSEPNKKKFEKFFNKRNIRKTAPINPDHA